MGKFLDRVALGIRRDDLSGKRGFVFEVRRGKIEGLAFGERGRCLGGEAGGHPFRQKDLGTKDHLRYGGGVRNVTGGQ